jgi:SAM-dependent methyltransferase
VTEPLERPNLVDHRSEAWRPPTFRRANTRMARIAAGARRGLDLQAASIWRDLLALLSPIQGDVLDVGCGAQPYRELFHPQANYRAIDSAGAEHNFGYAVPDTTYYEGDCWPIDNASIDVILCTETLEHVPDPSVFLAEAARCLRPGGWLLLTVPFAARWHYIPHDYWRFTPSGLQRLLGAAGFEQIAVFARGNALTVACYKVMALMLPLLVAQDHALPIRLTRQVCGAACLPILLLLSAIAHLSLRGKGGEDCLGYTVTARMPGANA